MGHVAPIGSDIASLIFETCTDALETGILVFSKGDHILAASRNAATFFPVSDEFLKPGTSLRAFLIALYEVTLSGIQAGAYAKAVASRDEWVSERIATMWHERWEGEERIGRERQLGLTTRRLASGLGLLMVRDVSARRKVEERWKSDLERVAMTEDVLDNLPSMLFVLDRNLNYVAVNKAYSRFYGAPADSILSRRMGDVVDPANAERYEAEARDVLTTGKSVAVHEYVITGGERVCFLKQRFRLGKPGNHFVVTLLQQVADVVDAIPAAPTSVDLRPSSLEDDVPFQGHSAGGTERMPTCTVLLLSSDEGFGEALNEALRAFRFDACHATSADEACAIIAAAREAGVVIDLLMIDDADMDTSMIAPLGIQTLPISRMRPVHFAVAEAAAALTLNTRSAAIEIDTDYLPEFPEPNRVPDPSGFGVEMLVVEDNAVNQEVYAQILTSLGISYELATDGNEALRLWNLLRPPLVFMDLGLPDISGFEVAERIRAAEHGATERTHIVGVMPRLSQENHDKCLTAGMDETIVKPLAVETIDAVCKRHVISMLERGDAERLAR
jgi:CheY-like chemotaxis protein/PAS domain-containing protein